MGGGGGGSFVAELHINHMLHKVISYNSGELKWDGLSVGI